ncbi:unnamed protein product [Rotaria sp. Silwood2]|nr:unnamed protein product [Rotaria sp. Silwood2]CAF2500215.1 unnamed protein product [Rotaria sp. Silwood2]CAF2897740.1 unnamed protein product [Rotaria sp. Silwood2]CAF3962570.1 unnamed protein product [Rotaria sp. Silwood2]CAF4472992.1 unnamed protein product [Rotaria sp. Silwood2]
MPASNKMFVEPSHLTMPPSVWLHVNGVSLTTDFHQYQSPVHTYDYRTKHLQSPVRTPTPPLVSSPTIVPCSITMIDGPFGNNTNKQYQKLDNIDLPKKLFIDRHIKKAKSLPGLIKGTALSRHTPLHSSTFTSPAPANPLAIKIQDDQLPNVTIDNDDDSLPLSQTLIHQNDIRRPRVYFADFNKIQIIEDNNETSQQNHIKRRHRQRTKKRISNTNGNNYISPSIQQPQTLHNSTLPLSHQSYHHIGQELNTKKQQLLLTHRTNSSRSTHLPDILNQSLSNETSLNDNSNGKYILQREKPLNYIPKPVHDMPSNSSMDILSENTHNGSNIHSSSTQDSHNQSHESESIDNSNGILLTSSSISSTSTSRQRSLLHSISLRQQFNSPIKIKATGISSTTTTTTNNNNNHHHQQQMNNSKLNPHRSISLKNSASKTSDDNDDLNLNKSSSITDNRPITANGSVKQLKRSDVIHFNSKNPFRNDPINDLNEINRHMNKTNIHEINQERFQNLLTIVRPPYATNNSTSSQISSTIMPIDSTRQTNNHNQTKRNIRSSRSTSARGSVGLHIASNTITV